MFNGSDTGILFITIGRFDNSLRMDIQRFSFHKLYIIHSNHQSLNDIVMKSSLDQNLRDIKLQYPTAEFIELFIYDFYQNVYEIRKYFKKYKNDPIICDITGGDKIISDAIIYARLIENDRENISIYYQKRDEDVKYEQERFIQLINLPQITQKQKDFLSNIDYGDSIDKIAEIIGTTRNNVWNYVNILESMHLLYANKETDMVSINMPYNIYKNIKLIDDHDDYITSKLREIVQSEIRDENKLQKINEKIIEIKEILQGEK